MISYSVLLLNEILGLGFLGCALCPGRRSALILTMDHDGLELVCIVY